jgi:hypothetical protein
MYREITNGKVSAVGVRHGSERWMAVGWRRVTD